VSSLSQQGLYELAAVDAGAPKTDHEADKTAGRCVRFILENVGKFTSMLTRGRRCWAQYPGRTHPALLRHSFSCALEIRPFLELRGALVKDQLTAQN
jgi:hypothetical protein